MLDPKLIIETFHNQFGQTVQLVEAQHQGIRPAGIKPDLLFWHHSTVEDCRADGIANNRTVSWHYSVGRYDGSTEVSICKYMSEQLCVAYTEGFGLLGGYRGNLNSYGVSVEIEGPPIDAGLIEGAALLGADIIIRAYRQGVNMKQLTHAMVDPNKTDPLCDVLRLMTRTSYHVNRVLFPEIGS